MNDDKNKELFDKFGMALGEFLASWEGKISIGMAAYIFIANGADLIFRITSREQAIDMISKACSAGYGSSLIPCEDEREAKE